MKLINVFFLLAAIAGIIGFFTDWIIVTPNLQAMLEMVGFQIEIPPTGYEIFQFGITESTKELIALILFPIVFGFIAIYKTGVLGRWNVLLVKLIQILPVGYLIVIAIAAREESSMDFGQLWDVAVKYRQLIGVGAYLTVISSILVLIDPLVPNKR